MLATTITLGVVGAKVTETFLRDRFQDRMAFLARYLALNSELGILIGDRHMLERLARNLLAEKDVVRVAVKDRQGGILVQVGQESTKEQAFETTAEVRLHQQEEETAFLPGAKGGAILGTVHLFYTAGGIEQLLSNFRMHYAIATLILASLGMVLFSFFARSMTAPLKALAKAARKVAQGRMDIRVRGGSLPETREVAVAFNNMLASLEANTKALEKTYQEMIQQKALAEVGHFALTVAHEIKNPLGIIKGSMDILKKEEVDHETKITMIGYLEDEVQRLNRIIQDFLRFARPKKANFEQVDMNHLLLEVANKVLIEWEPKGVSLDIQVNGGKAIVKGDPDLLSQAFLNILKNACEACDDHDRRVRISSHESAGYWFGEFSDTGSGISQEDRNRVFEPFYTTKTKGTGLGLSFVMRVMDMHEGTIHILDNSPSGTTFRVELPLAGEK